MLDECLEFLEKRSSSYEVRMSIGGSIIFFSQKVIIVDDGSKDTTTAVGLDYVEKFGCDKVKLLHTDNDLLTNSCHVFTINCLLY